MNCLKRLINIYFFHIFTRSCESMNFSKFFRFFFQICFRNNRIVVLSITSAANWQVDTRLWGSIEIEQKSWFKILNWNSKLIWNFEEMETKKMFAENMRIIWTKLSEWNDLVNKNIYTVLNLYKLIFFKRINSFATEANL